MYDRQGTRPLRLLPENDFSRKEFVPVEAVYAYVEVKHNLILAPGGSFDKALAQAAAAKSLPRKDRKHTEIALGFDLDLPMKQGELVHPERANPMLGVIIYAKLEMDERRVDPIKYSTGDPKLLPDLVIAGTDFVGIPGIEERKSCNSESIQRHSGSSAREEDSRQSVFDWPSCSDGLSPLD